MVSVLSTSQEPAAGGIRWRPMDSAWQLGVLRYPSASVGRNRHCRDRSARVRVLEVKHWAPQWVDTNEHLVEQEADRVTNKARKIGTTLRKAYQALPRVDGAILLTQETSQVKRLVGREVRGVRFHSLNEWKTAIDFDASRALSPTDITRLGRVLEPKSGVAIDGSLRRLAGYVNLELHTPKAERFHRVYKGGHPARRDRVVLHLYDLSASDAKNAEAKAKREFAKRCTGCRSTAGHRGSLTRTKKCRATLGKCTSSPSSILQSPASKAGPRTRRGPPAAVLHLREMPLGPCETCMRPAPRTSLSFIATSR